MRILFIRHADPDYDRDTITETGHQQAQALARRLSGTRLERLYVSPMGRARATARYIAEAQPLDPITLPWMRELNGNWEGDRWAWDMPGAEALVAETLPQVSDWHECVPYGKLLLPQWQALGQRFDDLLTELGYEREGHRYRVRRAHSGTVASVAHLGAHLAVLSHLLHWPLPLLYIHLGCDPASITELQWEEHDGYAVPRAIRVNDTSHWRG